MPYFTGFITIVQCGVSHTKAPAESHSVAAEEWLGVVASELGSSPIPDDKTPMGAPSYRAVFHTPYAVRDQAIGRSLEFLEASYHRDYLNPF